MTDFLYGQLKPNWTSNTGIESITSNMEFITITTAVDIRTYATALLAGQTVVQATASQTNLNKLLEIVSLRGQPVIMGSVTGTTGAWVILLATEHAGGWQNVNVGSAGSGILAPNSLISRIVADGINYGFGQNLSSNVTSATATGGVSGSATVTVASTTGIMAGDTFTGTGVTPASSVVEVISTTQFVANQVQTIAGAVTLTFVPAIGSGTNDTAGTGLFVAFTNVMT